MQTLATFYRSKEWERLVRTLRMERETEDGLVCAYCGKPIVKKYDAILHHKKHLTEENVNDAEIALNPDNLEFVHHKCHSRIHERLGAVRREVFLVYGSPLSGKSTWVESNRIEGDLVIDMDNIWECVSGEDRYIKPPRLNAVVFGVRDFLMDCVKTKRGKWKNAYIVGGFPLISERERIMKLYGARAVYIVSTKEECLARLALDPNRNTADWERYIEEWWRRYRPPGGGEEEAP